ncbi:MAG: uroporphyrinogen-III synthase [Thiohalocapsa sp.]
MNNPCALGGRGVLVTRPAAQARGLCDLIEAVGGRPVAFPTVEILPAREPDAARRLLSAPRDLVVFISRNAVSYALALLDDHAVLVGTSGTAEPVPQLAAVGRATATAMEQAGLAPDLVPSSGYDSESLLALPALARVGGKRVLIVRGEGGRALLGETLAQRGAEVVYAEVYRRAVPVTDSAALIPDWEQSLGFITATSDEVLLNLLAMVPTPAHRWLRGLPLAVLGERNAATAMRLGFRVVAVADEASDAGLCDALCRLHLNAPAKV